MGLNVELYLNFSKNKNSLAVPSSSYKFVVVKSVELKAPTSILDPTLILSVEELQKLNINLNEVTYLHIVNFNRWYYVGDMIFNGKTIELLCHCDALASFQNAILNLSGVVIERGWDGRSLTPSAPYTDVEIVDISAPMSQKSNITSYTPESIKVQGVESNNLFKTKITDGYFYVKIFSKEYTTGGVGIYIFTYEGFMALMDYAFNTAPEGFGDLASGMVTALADPIQYLNAIYWLPFKPNNALRVSDIKFGNYNMNIGYGRCWTIDLTNFDHVPSQGVITIDMLFSPQWDPVFAYKNYPPYRTFMFEMQPFGLITVNTDEISINTFGSENQLKLKASIDVDLMTGGAILYIKGGPRFTNVLAVHKGLISLDIPIIQEAKNLLYGTGQGVISAGQAILGAFTGNFGGIVDGALNAVKSAKTYLKQEATVEGIQGSLATFFGFPPYLIEETREQVYYDYKDHGLPVMTSKYPLNHYSYVEIRAGEPFNIKNATTKELEEIRSYLENGCFMERYL